MSKKSHYLNKLKAIRNSELLPHYIGVIFGVAAGVLLGGIISDRADNAEQLIIEPLEATDDISS